MRELLCSLLILSLSCSASANVEKTVFLAPKRTSMSRDASIDNLLLFPLSPTNSTIRTKLRASFPTNETPKGTESWFILDNLSPGARYEVRICWLATQPTAFSLYTYTLPQAFEDPDLIISLSTFSRVQHASLNEVDMQRLQALRMTSRTVSEHPSSMLFLQICAAADYFSTNRTLMQMVPAVAVDIILDPYLLTVLPRSLVPTAGYLLVLAMGSWFLSGYIWRAILKYVSYENSENPTAKKTL